jgi:hypothetical protein
MSKVTLKTGGPASFSKHGEQFLPGVTREDVAAEIALDLVDDERFIVELDPALQTVSDTFETPKKGGKPKTMAEQHVAIQEAVGQLDPDDPAHFNTDTSPSSVALSKLLGWQVTNDLRNAALGIKSAPKAAAPKAPAAKPEKKSRITITRKGGAPVPADAPEPAPAKEGSGDLTRADMSDITGDASTQGAIEV